jgi:hypothetical protein
MIAIIVHQIYTTMTRVGILKGTMKHQHEAMTMMEIKISLCPFGMRQDIMCLGT